MELIHEDLIHKDESLLPAVLITDKETLTEPDSGYPDSERLFQGIPTVECTAEGRLYFAFYSGMSGEEAGNFIPVLKSDDKANTLPEIFMVITPPTDHVRCFDPCLWNAPDGRLWIFWAQSYGYFDGRIGVWCSVCENPDALAPVFSSPRRIANGVMMNKPIVLSDGRWLLPCAIWEGFRSELNDLPEERFSNVYCSEDGGRTFTLLSHTAYEDRRIDEHMMAEKNNGDIWMLIRAKKGIGQAISHDGGRSWDEAEDSGIAGPGSRFHIRRLKSGRLLLVNHVDFKSRNNLTAMLSEDDGVTWTSRLLLDERNDVSYPDVAEAPDGRLYIVHDYNRVTDREILMSIITEEDILSGALVSPGSRLGVLINKATGIKA